MKTTNTLLKLGYSIGFAFSGILTLSAQTDITSLAPKYEESTIDNRWEFDILAGIGTEPTYAGSKNHETEPLADFRATYSGPNGNQYKFSLGEIEGTFPLSEHWVAKVKFEYEEGRDADEDDLLKGLTPIRDTVEGELILAYLHNQNYYFVDFQPDLLGRGKGMVYFIGAGRFFSSSSGLWKFDTRLDVSFGNSEYMMTEFGISTADALTSGYSAYAPSSGLKSTTLDLLGQRVINEHWSLIGSLSAEYYFSTATDSPLIKDVGTDSTFELQLGMRYQF